MPSASVTAETRNNYRYASQKLPRGSLIHPGYTCNLPGSLLMIQDTPSYHLPACTTSIKQAWQLVLCQEDASALGMNKGIHSAGLKMALPPPSYAWGGTIPLASIQSQDSSQLNFC